MEWVEVRGETLEQAKEEALDQLGVASDDAEFEIVQEPETRWLGIKKTEARVRARVRPTQPRPKRDSRNGRRSKRGGSSQGGQSRQSNKGGSGKKQDRGGADGNAKSKGSSSGGNKKRGGSNAKAGSDKKERTQDGAKGAGSAGGGKGRRTGGTKGESNQKNGSKESTMNNDNDSAGGTPDRVAEPMPIEQQEAVVVEFLEGLAAGFGATASASTAMDDDVIIASIDGADLGLMIGPKGGTMHAIQELARSAVQRQSDGRDTSRLMVDVAGYRARRRAALAEFTKSQAATVLESGQDLALEPMGSADRKAVHDAVLEIDGVRSISEGDEPRRRIVLIPDEG